MKILKGIAIAVIIASLIMVSCAVVLAQAEDYPEFYPKLTIVVSVHADTVICQDKEGNLWAFFSEEKNWAIGDICNLMMWNNSENEIDHEIIEVYWEGYTENPSMFFFLNGWAH